MQKQLVIPLNEATFSKREQATFTIDMADVAAECALYLWNELDARTHTILRFDREYILDTLARSVTRNHALLALHSKHGRMVEMPADHRILHSPGSHLFTALKA